MSSVPTSGTPNHTHSITGADPTALPTGALTPGAALRYAWWCWIGFLLLPFFVFLAMLYHYMGVTPQAGMIPVANKWFLAAMAFLVFIVPAAIFWRSKLFKPYYLGQPVQPRTYLAGMVIVWAALSFAGILSLAGCLVTTTLIPGLVPAMIAFVLFLPLWPNGQTMVRTSGNSDDPQRYQEPR